MLDEYLDAIFVSPHKLIGGPGTPGLLVARRDLFTNRVPDVPGGGTVSFVNPEEHDYLADVDAAWSLFQGERRFLLGHSQGGTIALDSEPGRGTCARIRVPLAAGGTQRV